MATHAHPLKRFATGPLQGAALVLYFVLLPDVVLSKWGPSRHESNGAIVRGLLICLAVFWLLFLGQLIRNVVRVRRGALIGGSGNAWLASILVALLPFLLAASPAPSTRPTPPAQYAVPSGHPDTAGAHQVRVPPGRRSLPLSSMGAVPLALMAKRRGDQLRQQQFDLDDGQVDDTVSLLRASNPGVVKNVRELAGDRRDGVVTVTAGPASDSGTTSTDPLAVLVLRDDPRGTLISFAREGGCLKVPAHWSDHDLIDAVVALHDSGRLAFTRIEPELVRTLATRTLSSTLVVYLGAARDLDDGLRACTVTIEPVLDDEIAVNGAAIDVRSSVTRRRVTTAHATDPEPSEVRVEVLRADPRVVGLNEPFTSTLRRRCVEMTAYLALHRHEPVTGDRLRTRVLATADVDASTRTLANTASAVRRSLGLDARGPRLHPVTSSGLYVTHGVTCDLEIFHSLVARARQLTLEESSPLTQRALALVQGEPLASALRGFEWFLAEGYAARLQRDGEWAALALHGWALDVGDVELAFWAIAQGRLIDPYSDALAEAIARVPRLREFRRNGSSTAQDQAVGAGGAVVVRGPFERLGH